MLIDIYIRGLRISETSYLMLNILFSRWRGRYISTQGKNKNKNKISPKKKKKPNQNKPVTDTKLNQVMSEKSNTVLTIHKHDVSEDTLQGGQEKLRVLIR